MCAITTAGQNTIKTNKQSKGNRCNLPGWKEFASDLYDMSRETYTIREKAGRQGPFSDMKK